MLKRTESYKNIATYWSETITLHYLLEKEAGYSEYSCCCAQILNYTKNTT